MDPTGSGPPGVKGEKLFEYVKRWQSLDLVGVGSPGIFAIISCSAPANPGFAMSSRPNPKHVFSNSYLMFLSNNHVIEEFLTREKAKNELESRVMAKRG